MSQQPLQACAHIGRYSVGAIHCGEAARATIRERILDCMLTSVCTTMSGVASDMLQIAEPVSADDSIESFEYVEYTAAQSTNINASQAINIVAEGR